MRQELVLFNFRICREIKKLAWRHMARSDKARFFYYYHQLRFHRILSQDITFLSLMGFILTCYWKLEKESIIVHFKKTSKWQCGFTAVFCKIETIIPSKSATTRKCLIETKYLHGSKCTNTNLFVLRLASRKFFQGLFI